MLKSASNCIPSASLSNYEKFARPEFSKEICRLVASIESGAFVRGNSIQSYKIQGLITQLKSIATENLASIMSENFYQLALTYLHDPELQIFACKALKRLSQSGLPEAKAAEEQLAILKGTGGNWKQQTTSFLRRLAQPSNILPMASAFAFGGLVGRLSRLGAHQWLAKRGVQGLSSQIIGGSSALIAESAALPFGHVGGALALGQHASLRNYHAQFVDGLEFMGLLRVVGSSARSLYRTLHSVDTLGRATRWTQMAPKTKILFPLGFELTALVGHSAIKNPDSLWSFNIFSGLNTFIEMRLANGAIYALSPNIKSTFETLTLRAYHIAKQSISNFSKALKQSTHSGQQSSQLMFKQGFLEPAWHGAGTNQFISSPSPLGAKWASFSTGGQSEVAAGQRSDTVSPTQKVITENNGELKSDIKQAIETSIDLLETGRWIVQDPNKIRPPIWRYGYDYERDRSEYHILEIEIWDNLLQNLQKDPRRSQLVGRWEEGELPESRRRLRQVYEDINRLDEETPIVLNGDMAAEIVKLLKIAQEIAPEVIDLDPGVVLREIVHFNNALEYVQKLNQKNPWAGPVLEEHRRLNSLDPNQYYPIDWNTRKSFQGVFVSTYIHGDAHKALRSGNGVLVKCRRYDHANGLLSAAG